jgi:hypothetical protein
VANQFIAKDNEIAYYVRIMLAHFKYPGDLTGESNQIPTQIECAEILIR